MKSAISSEKDKYDKVLEAIITQENAVKALLGENYQKAEQRSSAFCI